MLSISSPAGASAVRYYSELAQDDYYAQRTNSPGTWYGSGAKALGLGGEASPEQIENLLRGFSPDGESKLVQNAGAENRKLGVDLTFSAPKSVSVEWGLLDEENREIIAQAHERAVEDTLNWLEQGGAVISRRGSGGSVHEEAKPICVLYNHGTSRNLDPQLHTHALVINACVREDGTTGAIEEKYFYDNKMVAGSFYRAELTQNLRELGIEMERRGDYYEIAGVPQSLMDEASSRRKEIENYMFNTGDYSPENASRGAIATRATKEIVPLADLVPAWNEMGKEHGFGREQAQALIEQARERNAEQELAPNLEEVFRTTEEELREKANHFNENEFLSKALANSSESNIEPRQVVEEGRNRLQSGGSWIQQGKEQEISEEKNEEESQSSKYFSNKQFEFKERQETNQLLIAKAEGLASSDFAFDNSSIESVLENAVLTPEQSKVTEDILSNTSSIALVDGISGSGKTRMLSGVVDAYQRDGVAVQPVSLTAQGAMNLERVTGTEARTVDSLIGKEDWYNGTLFNEIKSYEEEVRFRDSVPPPIEQGSVILVDNANQLNNERVDRLLDMARTYDSKLILVGDNLSVEPVGEGTPFRLLAGTLQTHTLEVSLRQGQTQEAERVRMFGLGEPREALENYRKEDKLLILGDMVELRDSLVRDWARDGGIENPEDHLIITSTKQEASMLNRLAHVEMHEQEQLGARWAVIHEKYFHTGDRIVLLENDREIGVVNGDLGTISSISLLGNKMEIDLDHGQIVSLNLSEYNAIDYGYALNVHKVQEQTPEHSYVFMAEQYQSKEISYSQLSRAKNSNKLYAFGDNEEKGLDYLEKITSRSSEQNYIHELLKTERQQDSGVQLEREEEEQEREQEEERNHEDEYEYDSYSDTGDTRQDYGHERTLEREISYDDYYRY